MSSVAQTAQATSTTATSGCSAAPAARADRPVRVAAAPTALSDARGARFTPDAPYAAGGTLVVDTGSISGTASTDLYSHLRRGGTTYAFPVATAGTYFVDLFVTEPQASPGQRVWRVRAEGAPVTHAVDVARAAGPRRAWHVMFAAPVRDGCLNLRIVPIVGAPLIGAVTVTDESAATVHTTDFDDEFTGTAGASPSANRWGFAYGGGGWGNHEQQTYTNRPDNAALDGAGHLVITARRETYTGYDGIKRQYTAARLTTRDTFTFEYGTATTRLRVPRGDGLLSAFWAMGHDVNSVGWPACGETDIIESLGSDPSAAHATIHAANRRGDAWLASGQTHARAFSSGFHTYTLTWGPGGIESDVDGLPYLAVSQSDITPDDYWPFNQPFFLLLSLAVGGDWAGQPDSSTSFPAALVVDYVRVRSA